MNTGAFTGEYKGKRRFIRFGTPGMSDIIGIYRGTFLAVETKRKGKKATELQEAFMSQVRQKGGMAFCVDDLDTLIRLMGEE